MGDSVIGTRTIDTHLGVPFIIATNTTDMDNAILYKTGYDLGVLNYFVHSVLGIYIIVSPQMYSANGTGHT